jgi:hypothetical protein
MDTAIVNAKVQSAVILVVTFRDGCALEGGTVIKPISILTCRIPSVCLEIIPTSHRGIILPPHAIFKRHLNLHGALESILHLDCPIFCANIQGLRPAYPPSSAGTPHKSE